MIYFITTVALVAFFARYYFLSRRVWDLVDTPTVSPSGAIIGLCEIKGRAISAETPSGEPLPIFTSPISGLPCVWYHVLVEWYNTSGKSASWDLYKQMYSQGGFRIADQYGSVAIDPRKMNSHFDSPVEQNSQAEYIMRAYNFFVQFPTGEDALVYSLWKTSPDNHYMWHPNINQWIPTRYVSPDRMHYFDWVQRRWFEIAPKQKNFFEFLIGLSGDKWSNSKLRVSETIVVPDSEIFAHGYVKISGDGSDLIMGPKNNNVSGGYVSNRDEKEVIKRLKTSKWFVSFISVFLLIFSFVGPVYTKFNGSIIEFITSRSVFQLLFPFLAAVATIGLASLFLKFLRTYNRFVKLREQVRLSRSAIDVALNRRSSLIPELCDTVEGAMAHESQLMELISKIRSEDPSLAIKDIFALGEAYPNLKTVDNYLQLQNELGRTEEKIAMARSFYNDSLLAMDNLRATLSGIVLSPLFAKEPPLKL